MSIPDPEHHARRALHVTGEALVIIQELEERFGRRQNKDDGFGRLPEGYFFSLP